MSDESFFLAMHSPIITGDTCIGLCHNLLSNIRHLHLIYDSYNKFMINSLYLHTAFKAGIFLLIYSVVPLEGNGALGFARQLTCHVNHFSLLIS